MNEFDSFELNGIIVYLGSDEVLTDDGITKLTPKEIGVLLILYNNRGHTVSQNRILDAVWGESLGNDSGLTQAISRLRRIFKDTPKSSTFIRTIPKKGYQLVVDSDRTLQVKKKKNGIFSGYDRLSKIQKFGVKLLIVMIMIIILLLLVDINIRVEQLNSTHIST